MSSPLEDIFQPNVDDTEEPEDVQDVTSEESSTSDSPGEGSDSEPEGPAGDPVPVENRVAEMERKLREMSSQVVDLVAENAALKTSAKEAEGKKKDSYSVEQLKEFATKDEGRYAFDAAATYVQQEVGRLEDRIKELTELTQASEEQAIQSVIDEVLPGLGDRSSANYRKVQNEALAMQRRGIRDPGKAWEAAMFKVAAMSQKPQPKPKGDPEYSARRAREEAGGVGGPKGGGDRGKATDSQMTQEQLTLAKRMGMKSVFDPDPKKRARARAIFLKRAQNYQERRIA